MSENTAAAAGEFLSENSNGPITNLLYDGRGNFLYLFTEKIDTFWQKWKKTQSAATKIFQIIT
jgi:hypothetical protein